MSRANRSNDLYVSWSSETSEDSSLPLELGIKTPTSTATEGEEKDEVKSMTPRSTNEPQQIDFYSYSEDEARGTGNEQEATKKKRCSWTRLACCLLLLVFLGILVSLVIFFASWDWDSILALLGSKNDATVENDAIASAPTSYPSAAPSESSPYEPPSLADCMAIVKGDTVQDQDQMLVEQYEVDLDVSLNFGGGDFDSLLDRLSSEIQQTILPELAGCEDSNRKLMELNLPLLIRGGRQLNTRYVIANAAIAVANPLGEWCSAGSGPLCYRVVVTMDVALKGDIKVMTVIRLLTEAFQAESLVSKLGLGSPFQSVVLKSVLPTFATPSPSSQPSI
eukprot:scaffold12503_cov143-Cylindrotheca_fusiformis.AAC.1